MSSENNSIIISNKDINIELNTQTNKINQTNPPNKIVLKAHTYAEKYVEIMFKLSLLYKYNNNYKIIKYIILILANTIIITGFLSPIWHPRYYLHQTEIWTSHIVLLWPIYNYLFYLRNKWKDISLFENVEISKYDNYITLFFYILYMLYWAYFAGIMLYENREFSVEYQFGNIFMSIVWYLFFSTAATIFYYTATIILQRAAIIKKHIKKLKLSQNLRDDFFTIYDNEYKKNRKLANVWNKFIFIVILVLFFNIPIDLIAIFFKGALYDIPGVIMKFLGFIWYIVCICKLNHMETYMISYLHKHHYLQADMEEINQYILVRPLCLNFYGIKITFEFVAKVLLILINLIIPTLYGLISNKILKIDIDTS
jgi:hypothetical protein